jgi:hypothetical protein
LEVVEYLSAVAEGTTVLEEKEEGGYGEKQIPQRGRNEGKVCRNSQKGDG